MTAFPDCRILAIEDDPVLGAHLNDYLVRQGFAVTLCDDGSEGLALAGEHDFDLILLDILLPGLDGLEVLARLRLRRHVPVILISALGDEQDRITGFSRGADDYLPKPFGMGELQVRIEAILRRIAYERGQPMPSSNSPLYFDEERCDIRHGDAWARLTATEYRLLETLGRHPGEMLSKPFLYQQVLRRGYSQHDRSLDMHVSNIRRKLACVGLHGVRLETVWGRGYMLKLQAG